MAATSSLDVSQKAISLPLADADPGLRSRARVDVFFPDELVFLFLVLVVVSEFTRRRTSTPTSDTLTQSQRKE